TAAKIISNGAFAYNSADVAYWPENNVFRYLAFSAQGARLFRYSKRLSFKAGLGIGAGKPLTAYYNSVAGPDFYNFEYRPSGLSKLLTNVSVNTGIVLKAGKRWQFQACP